MHAVRYLMFPLCAGAVVVLLGIHVGMTLVYLMPLNPIKLHLAPTVESYMTPWFAQDWHLFAPDPIDETRMLLVSCRIRQSNGLTHETAWADVSTPLWSAQAVQRFSSAPWLVRPQAHAVQLYFDENEIVAALERHRTGDSASMNDLADAIRAAHDARRTLATHVLARLSAAYCDRWYGTGQTVATRASLAVLRFPRFSQRQLPDDHGTLHVYTFAWLPYEHVSPLMDTGT